MALLRRIANLMHRSRVDREIEAELESHIAMRIDENIAAGMAPDQARRDALLRFGNPTSTRERVAAADTTLSLERLRADLRYAVRQLLKTSQFVFGS